MIEFATVLQSRREGGGNILCTACTPDYGDSQQPWEAIARRKWIGCTRRSGDITGAFFFSRYSSFLQVRPQVGGFPDEYAHAHPAMGIQLEAPIQSVTYHCSRSYCREKYLQVSRFILPLRSDLTLLSHLAASGSISVLRKHHYQRQHHTTLTLHFRLQPKAV